MATDIILLTNPDGLFGTRNVEYFSILNLERSASMADVADAYRREATKWHPEKATSKDKESATHRFRLVAEAYSALSDPIRRQVYEQYGSEGLRQGVTGIFSPWAFVSDPVKIYESFFGSYSPFANLHAIEPTLKVRSIAKTKPDDLIINVPISLEDLFHSRTQTVTFTRTRLSPADNRTPISDSCSLSCIPVDGRLRFPGQGDQPHPMMSPGDAVVVFSVQKHKLYTPGGNGQLIYHHRVKLCDALCGINIQIVSLSGAQQVLPLQRIASSVLRLIQD